MKAWQFEGTGMPLTLREVEEPTAGPGEVVVEVKATGVCHSDVTTLDDPGWMALFEKGLPRTMGHESAGVIVEVGDGMESWKVGDRVGLAPVMRDGDVLGYGAWDGVSSRGSAPPPTTWSPCPTRSPSTSGPWPPMPGSPPITRWWP